MAFQVGDIKLSGTVDDLSFYHSVFGWLVRTKSGPGSEQFKNAPAFARARENSSEFTRCSRMASAIRRLVLLHTQGTDKTLYHRLITLMRALASDDKISVRGERDPGKGMQSVVGLRRLKHFEIEKGLSLYEILRTTKYLKPAEKKQNIPGAGLKRKRRILVFFDRNRKPALKTMPVMLKNKQSSSPGHHLITRYQAGYPKQKSNLFGKRLLLIEIV